MASSIFLYGTAFFCGASRENKELPMIFWHYCLMKKILKTPSILYISENVFEIQKCKTN